MDVHDEDLHATVRNKEKEHIGDVLMGDVDVFNEEDEEIWLQNQDHELLVDLNDGSSLFDTGLPSLPDFPGISSSSSSCSTPTPVKSMVCSSSSASSSVVASSSSSTSGASWTVLRADAEEEDPHHSNRHQGCDFNNVYNQPATETTEKTAFSSTASVDISQPSTEDAMETFECMDFFDPSSVFNPDETLTFSFDDFSEHHENPEIQMQEMEIDEETQHHHHHHHRQEVFNGGGISSEGDDLGKVFFEWLKTNKDTVSAEDLRNIKIKNSTIESAGKKLGGGKGALKQLLKLVLEWVQTNHLQKRRLNPTTDPNLNSNLSPPELHPNNQCYSQSPWIHNPDNISDSMVTNPGFEETMVGSIGNEDPNSDQPPPFNGEYNHMLDSSPAWSPSQMNAPFQDDYAQQVPGITGYGSTQYPYPTVDNNSNTQHYDNQYVYPDQRLVRFPSSVTKEARKKRMARQRRLLSNHIHRNPATGGGGDGEGEGEGGGGGYQVQFDNDGHPSTNLANGAAGVQQNIDQAASSPPSTATGAPPHATGQGHQSVQSSDRRQKEAEAHLPSLDARDGISIAMEDIVTSRVWYMRYRYWPNNRSRMYVLENTGDFVKTNGLKEGDFIVLYSDVKCGKYLIRGVKLRQEGLKWENIKIGGRSQRNYRHSTNG